MFTEGIFPIGDGLLDIDEEKFKGLLVPHDINEIYDVEQTPFARGKFAAVRRAVHKNSGVHFAAKFLKRRRRAQSSDKEIKHEIAVLMLCDGAHNIVKLNAVHETRSDTALLLELATGGELQTFLDNEECLNESQARICMREVLKALQFLHKRSIAHLDLKPQNILLNSERIEDGLKLCDFGISRVVAEGTNVREIVGTPDYVAPEVLQYEPLSLLTDIWSVGVLAYVLLSGFSPFGGETKQETFLNISQCTLSFPDKLFGGVSASAIDFMRRALRIKPSDRMSAAGCLEHNWLKDECSIELEIRTNTSTKETMEDLDDLEDMEEIEEEDEEIVESESNGKCEEHHELPALINATKMETPLHMEEEPIKTPPVSNGKSFKISLKPTHTYKSKIPSITTTKTTTLNVPAARATTIPLCNNPMQQKPSFSTVRRHSSGSANKENQQKHFLTTKKVLPAAGMDNGNKARTTATIVIASANGSTTTTTTTTTPLVMSTSPVVTKIAMPRNMSAGAVAASNEKCISLFPDAPTTPKVIRKAPTTDTSPTSVKALVKKFQHDAANLSPEQQQQKSPPNGCTSPANNSITIPSNAFNNNSSSSSSCNSSSQHRNNHNGRRASEPLTSLHKKSPSTSSPTAASYKSSCVLCLTCGNSSVNGSTTGCRHPQMMANGSAGSRKESSSLLLTQIPHHHHHHRAVVAGASKTNTTNNISLDQGIIC